MGRSKQIQDAFCMESWDLLSRTLGVRGAQTHPVLILAAEAGGTRHHSLIKPRLRCRNHVSDALTSGALLTLQGQLLPAGANSQR